MKIGLTKTENEKKHQHYISWLKGNNDIEVLTITAGEQHTDAVKSCDALVLSGGVDIHPEFYGVDILDYANAPEEFKKHRDEFEIAAFNQARENNIPILGICRGFQLINCIMGGTLKQDLGDAGNKTHWAEKKPADKTHEVTIEDGSLLQSIALAKTGFVNSAHHQSIDMLGKGLKANCISVDGTIEGIEWDEKKEKPFMLAVQWHPERMFQSNLQDSPLAKKIRDHFIQEINKSKSIST